MILNSANGKVPVANLGKTLMHEHLLVAFPGWEGDTETPPASRREIVDACVERVEELKSGGFGALLDPCPNDLGRDVDVLGEVAARTGFNILFATGLYMDHFAGAHWKLKLGMDPDGVRRLADMYIKEITDGVGSTGLKPAVIKVACGKAPFTKFEEKVMQASALAAVATGTPIITHTEGVDGDLQLGVLTGHGVEAGRVIIGHSCANPDHAYHRKIVDGGAYLGFDRFGIERLRSDQGRMESLVQMIDAGLSERVIISHDCVFHMRGNLSPRGGPPIPMRNPMHFTRVLAPKLRDMGVAQGTIDSMLTDKPRRYFEGARVAA